MSYSFKTPFQQVGDLYRDVLGIAFPNKPQLLAEHDEQRRMTHIHEEVGELQDAYKDRDLVAAADALADLVYVALGTAYEMGLPFDDIWRAVHYANMRKRPGMSKRGFALDLVKPEGWVDPKQQIQEMLNERK